MRISDWSSDVCSSDLLALEERGAHQLALVKRRHQQRAQPAPACREQTHFSRLEAALPFALTSAQQRVVAEILADLGKPVPMLRLLQGDENGRESGRGRVG